MFVLQQHECAFSSVLCCVAMLRCGQGCGSVSFVNIWMFKQAKVELGAQYATDSFIQHLHRDTSVLYRFGQVLVCGLEHRHFHIKTGVDGSRARIGQVLGEVLDGERVDSVRVRHNEPLEAEFVAKRVGQQPLVARGRHAVQIHVRAHDVACASGNSVTERRQIHVVKFRIGQVDVFVVAATASRTVTGKVLGTSEDGVTWHSAVRARTALEACHLSGSHRTAQVGIFTCAFNDASPSRVSCNVDHRCKCPVDAD